MLAQLGQVPFASLSVLDVGTSDTFVSSLLRAPSKVRSDEVPRCSLEGAWIPTLPYIGRRPPLEMLLDAACDGFLLAATWGNLSEILVKNCGP